MNRPYGTLRAVEARFAAMQRNAGVSVGVATVLSLVAVWAFSPGPLFVIGSLVGGVLVFLCWRAAAFLRHGYAGALAVGAVFVMLASASAELSRPLPVVLSVGLPLVCVGLFSPLLLTRPSRVKPAP